MDEPDLTPSESRESAMLLFGGIAILMLSFFVVLTHSATMEAKKAGKVTRAVAARFDPTARSEDRLVSDIGQAIGEESAIGRVGKLVTTVFPLAEMKVIEPGRMLVVELPLGHMWVEDKVAPTDSGRRLIALLARSLAEPQARRLYAVDAWLIGATDLPRPLALARIATFGDLLVTAGAPAAAVATGLESGASSRLRLVFNGR
jgi:hypothetical protein